MAKYEEGFWLTKGVTSHYETSLWRSIRNFWPGVGQKISFNVEDGRRIMFWKETGWEMAS